MNLPVSLQARPPRWRQCLLYLGTVLALSVYYFNYDATFDEGDIRDAGPLTLLTRLSAVCLIVVGLLPLRLPSRSALMFAALYIYGATSLMLAAYLNGGLNDRFFFNTVMQLPVLLALVGTRWEIDYVRWLRAICEVLAVQVGIDFLIWESGQSLWLSEAFIGGLGNPSSFGLLCSIGLAFCIFHPLAGRVRWMLAIVLAIGALQTKALFAAFAVALVAGCWMVTVVRRTFVGVLIGLTIGLISVFLHSGVSDDGEISFLEHKLKAVGAALLLVEYDVESSASVSQRVEMHKQTFVEIAAAPFDLVWGHLGGLPYWPMDSQLLTYLGSFGIPFVGIFLLLHIHWTVCAWRVRHIDKGFGLLSLSIFGLIFVANRIFDYYPTAIIYFLIVASVLKRHSVRRDERL